VGKFRAEAVIVKHVNNIEIVFYNKETIYVKNGDRWVIFHRWFAPKGSYKDWEIFKHLLLSSKHADLTYCYEKALCYEISSQLASRPPDLSKVKIDERGKNDSMFKR